MKSDYDIPEQLQAVSAPVGSWHMSRLLNYLHIWILFGAALLIFSGKEELSPEMLLLMTVFVGGFVFHAFWEAKGQYTLPYFVLLIPLAVQGYWSVLTAAKTGGKKTGAPLWGLAGAGAGGGSGDKNTPHPGFVDRFDQILPLFGHIGKNHPSLRWVIL